MRCWTIAAIRPSTVRSIGAGLLAAAVMVGAACSESQSNAGSGGGSSDAASDEPVDIDTVVVIGDSLTEGSYDAVAEAIPAEGYDPLLIDGVSGRRASADPQDGPNPGVDAIEDAKEAGHDPDAWVIALGTNDVPHYDTEGYASVVGDVLDALPADDTPVVWVDVYLRDDEERETQFNDTLEATLGDRPHTVIAEWTSKAWQEGVLSNDGIHPTHEGGSAFAATIVEGLDALGQ